jgi:SAM-dependent methyltransferase
MTNTDNLSVFRSEKTVAEYAAYCHLQPVEVDIFRKYVRPGMDILDLGVGAGRTTYYLSENAHRYVGVDYSAEMIAVCCSKFPHLEFAVRDATDLSAYGDASYDLVVFSFNGIGYIRTDQGRMRCLGEIRRVLRPGGTFVFSVHNPRSILLRPARSGPGLKGLAIGAIKSTITNLKRISHRAASKALWNGSGYVYTEAHGGLIHFAATPQFVRTELATAGFHQLDRLNEDTPAPDNPLITRWYYFVARKS